MQKDLSLGGRDPEARKVLAEIECDLPKTPDTASPLKKKRPDATVEAVILLLAERWPATFSIREARRKPLKIGIHLDVMAAIDGAITRVELSRALGCYVANGAYLSRLREGAKRIGLDGEPSGTVTAEQENHSKLLRWMSAVEQQRRERT
jgi:sRNA-binding protein